MPKVIAMGGGKGGIGKSFVIANMAALMAAIGKKTVILDLDLGTANQHTFFGITNPEKGLQNFLRKDLENLADTAIPTPYKNLDLISAKSCPTHIANLPFAQKAKIIRALKELPYQLILIDLGAGTQFNTLDFFLCANLGLILSTTEPTSIENAFRFIHALYFRKLKQAISTATVNSVTAEFLRNHEGMSVKPGDIVTHLKVIDPPLAQKAEKSLAEIRCMFIMNQLRRASNMRIGESLALFYSKFFNAEFSFGGNIRYDDLAFDAVFKKKIFVYEYMDSPITKNIMAIVKKII